MQDIPDRDLIQQFARNESEAAFGELVRRHIALVYSVALRHTDNPHHAQEISQAVFIILARKAGSIGRRTVLGGWLYHTARLTAANFRRSEFRRIRREQEAFIQSTTDGATADPAWLELAPLLDEAMGRLGATDRDAVVLRYFQNKSLSEVGAALGMEERAAQKRVHRALEKLRKIFGKRGITLSAVAIAGAVSVNSVQAAPVSLVKSVTTAAILKGSVASGSTLTLIKGALKIMAWSKAKSVIVIGVVALFAVGTTGIAVRDVYLRKMYSWETLGPTLKTLEQAPSMVAILPAKFPTGPGFWVARDGKGIGIGTRVNDILEFAYTTDARMVFATELPQRRYDFIANLSQGSSQVALQNEIKKKFGLVAQKEMVETNVFILTMRNPGAQGLKPNRTHDQPNRNPQFGEYSCVNQPLSGLTYFLELYTKMPVIDRTGLTGNFDMDVKWNDPDRERRNIDGLKQALLETTGLELVPGTEPVEMLVVDKVK